MGSIGEVEEDGGFFLSVGDFDDLVDFDEGGDPFILSLEMGDDFDKGVTGLLFNVTEGGVFGSLAPGKYLRKFLIGWFHG